MINQLVEKIKKTNAPVVVGLDPMLSYIPEHILKKSYDEYGETLKGADVSGAAISCASCNKCRKAVPTNKV